MVAGSWLLVMATASLPGFLEVVRSMELVGEVRVVRLVMVGHHRQVGTNPVVIEKVNSMVRENHVVGMETGCDGASGGDEIASSGSTHSSTFR